MAQTPRAAGSILAATVGVVLLFLASVLAFLGSADSLGGMHGPASHHFQAPARRIAAEDWNQATIDRVIPDPNNPEKEDIVYRNPDGTEVNSDPDGVQWEETEALKELEAEERNKHRKHALLPALISLLIHVSFAVMYKNWVVDMIPPLSQQPISIDEDFRQDIMECTKTGNLQLCLHATFCCQCRAAHTWHVAGVCEYWPALFLLFFASVTKMACCVDAFVYTYFRMKLKDKLGIKRNPCWDLVYSMFCPCCAVGQEAMAVDAELGTNVECCCQLSGPLHIGSVDQMERGSIIQLRNPNDPSIEAGE